MISFSLSRHDGIWRFSRLAQLMLGTAITVLISMTDVNASPADDIKAVAALDTQYQNAVKREQCRDDGSDSGRRFRFGNWPRQSVWQRRTAEGSEREASDLSAPRGGSGFPKGASMG